MEEDIKILENFTQYNKFYKEENGKLTITIDLDVKTTLDKAIENLIKAYKELEEENKRLEKNYINPSKARILYYDTKKGTEVVIEGFVPKSLIKEKIEHLKSFKGLVMYEKYNYEEVIIHLEELLGEEK